MWPRLSEAQLFSASSNAHCKNSDLPPLLCLPGGQQGTILFSDDPLRSLCFPPFAQPAIAVESQEAALTPVKVSGRAPDGPCSPLPNYPRKAAFSSPPFRQSCCLEDACCLSERWFELFWCTPSPSTHPGKDQSPPRLTCKLAPHSLPMAGTYLVAASSLILPFC